MQELYELKKKLLKELCDYAENNKFSKEDAEIMKYLSSTIDHICNIVSEMDEDDYSGNYYGNDGGMSYERDGRDGSYNRGASYARGRNARRDSMGRYSRGSEPEHMVMELREAMGMASDPTVRDDIKRLIDKVERM